MPNRMIRDWTDSLRMDGLSAEGERLFTRLIMKADDYGRFHGELRLVKASCFPLAESTKTSDIGEWIKELSDRGLVVTYHADGRAMIAIVNYGQRLKMSRAKFPPMPGESDEWLPKFNGFHQVPGSSGKFPSEEKPKGSRTEAEYEAEAGSEISPPPPTGDEWSGRNKRIATFKQVLKFGQAQTPPISEECCEAFFDRMESDGWITKEGHPLSDWIPRFRTWTRAWYLNSTGKGLNK